MTAASMEGGTTLSLFREQVDCTIMLGFISFNSFQAARGLDASVLLRAASSFVHDSGEKVVLKNLILPS